MSKSVIITCAITGSLHTPSMSPYLPITPDQIAAESIAAAEAGAAILHMHARDPETGKPTPDTEVYRQFLPRIKQSTDAVVNITTGGAPGMTMDERLAAAEWASPEMTSLNMGSLNFALFPVLDRLKEFKHPWEAAFLEGSRDAVFKNTFKDIEQIIERLGKGHGCRFEFECYDVGHLYNLAHFVDRKLYEPPLFIQFCLGILGGAGAEIDNLLFMVRTAERLFGDAFEWSVLGAGRHQMPMCVQNVLLGGNARVGLEDSLMIERGKLATSNAEQVTKLAGIVRTMGYDVATPDQARERLGLKGADQVRF
ncbi:3-keto-5-aminohexanoate cleavage protein [Novosphingobium album (ex Hu et al. 2023)]|uniref:3-keto-5-aminohexanoate cleavage protein n=1 Tax=Novosphingobium album (ex Hu et al. 2023) TaxID=2930093 RepID=A0ABT0B6T6_9SPHN|nr:3-keto-5-aminohexanoate cleavage protein [Novosphingobium album (ex Hu et al. 2023)]MCJ2180761.1 3-keto-5-aminohexanoate cleavage protein [Novosphingobium album (ex Hu et al. 2023)]